MNKINRILLLVTFCSSIFLSVTAQPAEPSGSHVAVQYGRPFSNIPDNRDVILYQVNMRVFSPGGNFKGVTARIDSIKALGANVIYLMPIFPVGRERSVNSPYCIRDYNSINEEFGTLADLRELVDKAHEKNMAVILDWVANHTAYDHEWTKNKSWYLQDSVGNIISPPGMGWNDVAQLNFNNLEMRLEMIRSMKNWVLKANIDGFRCDYSDGPPLDFWKQALDTMRNITSHKLLMLAEGSRNGNFSVGFDYNFGFGFFGTMKRIFERGRSATLVDSINKMDYTGALENQMMVRYTSNHDVNGSDGTPQELFGGEKGAMSAFIVACYMKSIPMIYNGQEVGTPFRLLFPFTTAKIDWTLNPGVTAEYKKILAFRNQSMAIRRGGLESITNDDVCAFIKTFGNEKVLVLANLRDKKVSFQIPFTLKNDKWQDAFNGKSIKLKQTTHLDPYEYMVLRIK